jgi:hypothetical protein
MITLVEFSACTVLDGYYKSEAEAITRLIAKVVTLQPADSEEYCEVRELLASLNEFIKHWREHGPLSHTYVLEKQVQLARQFREAYRAIGDITSLHTLTYE